MNKKVVLVFDALNELSPVGRSLTWLPITPPRGCLFVFSSIDPSSQAGSCTEALSTTPSEETAEQQTLRNLQQRYADLEVLSLDTLQIADAGNMLKQMLLETSSLAGEDCNDEANPFGNAPLLEEIVAAFLAADDPDGLELSPLYLKLLAKEIQIAMAFGGGNAFSSLYSPPVLVCPSFVMSLSFV